jgi:prepilin peptidase CpaA
VKIRARDGSGGEQPRKIDGPSADDFRPQNGSFSISWENHGPVARPTNQARHQAEGSLKPVILVGAELLAILAGWTDFRSRRIPNWLTVPGLLVGLAMNTALGRWDGLKTSLLGAAVGLALLLPFVLLRSLGAGDWKLAGALGAFTGPGRLIDLLLGSVFVAGIMAVCLVIYKGRTRQTIRNIGHILVSLVTFQLPGDRVSLDNPDSLKVPYGVALAFTVVLYGIFWKLGRVV